MSEVIEPQPWMTGPVTAVLAALEAAGGPGCARFVGGCVRNAVMRRPVDDVDIATTLTPDAVTAALAAAGLKAVPTGVEHGTVTAISQGQPFEITTLRRDVTTDGRNATVAFTDDWAEDAGRRDFRFNALYADGAGQIFDPVGEGLSDALAGRVVFVGDAATRVREDYLRILRYFRFLAWYGAAAPDAAALAACAEGVPGMARLSAERVSKELLKLLAAHDPREAVRLMAQTGVLTAVLPESGALTRFEGLVELEVEAMIEPDPVLRLAALLGHSADPVVLAGRLRLSNAQRDRLAAALGEGPALTSWMSPRAARRAVYQLGSQSFADKVKLAWAASGRTAAVPQWRALLALGETWHVPSLPISGADALAMGAPKGPLVGQVLAEVEAWWIDQDFPEDRLGAIEQLKAVVQGLAR